MARTTGTPVVITWDDVRGFKRFEKQIQQLQDQYPKALPRLMNQVGRRARTKVVRHLVKETGLQRDVIVRAVKESAASSGKMTGSLSYDLRTKGGNIRLKYLKPRETEEGVVAFPFNKQTLYLRTFMMGGRFPDRKTVEEFDGHVMFRNRSKGRHYTFARSGVFIPKVMVEGMARDAFEAEARTELPARLEALIRKLLG